MLPLFRCLIYQIGHCTMYFIFNPSFLFKLLLTKKRKRLEENKACMELKSIKQVTDLTYNSQNKFL